MLLVLGECHMNYHEASRVYQNRYPDRERHPNHSAIYYIEQRVRQGRLSRQKAHHVYNEDDVRVLVVLAAIHLNPHISTRVMAREIGIPRTTIQRILKQGNHPYHVTLTQALTQNDMQLRVQFCLWAQQMIRADQNFFYHVMFSDESSTFKNNGELNRHNCHYWSNVNPRWHVDK